MALSEFIPLFLFAALLLAFISSLVYFIFAALNHKVNLNKIVKASWKYFTNHYKAVLPMLILIFVVGTIGSAGEFLVLSLGVVGIPMIIASLFLGTYLVLSYQRSVIMHKRFHFEFMPIMTLLRILGSIIVGLLALAASFLALGITVPIVYNYFTMFLYSLYQDKTIQQASHDANKMYKNHKYDVYFPIALMTIVLGFISGVVQVSAIPLMFISPILMISVITLFSYLLITPLQVCFYAKIMEEST